MLFATHQQSNSNHTHLTTAWTPPRSTACPHCLPPTQIKKALKENFLRVIDLFREWDDDDSGTVDREEFFRAMGQLGFEVCRC